MSWDAGWAADAVNAWNVIATMVSTLAGSVCAPFDGGAQARRNAIKIEVGRRMRSIFFMLNLLKVLDRNHKERSFLFIR